MARTAKPKQAKTLEQRLWDAADALRGNQEPSEYKHVVLGLDPRTRLSSSTGRRKRSTFHSHPRLLTRKLQRSCQRCSLTTEALYSSISPRTTSTVTLSSRSWARSGSPRVGGS